MTLTQIVTGPVTPALAVLLALAFLVINLSQEIRLGCRYTFCSQENTPFGKLRKGDEVALPAEDRTLAGCEPGEPLFETKPSRWGKSYAQSFSKWFSSGLLDASGVVLT